MIRRGLLSLVLFLGMLLAVFLGLNTAEMGVQEIMGLKHRPGAFHLEVQENGITIIWAGREYTLP